jgi:MoaA/NifB/PqqE/SkfB family radical SAM enzyme
MVEDMEKYVAKNSIKYECYTEYPCGCITITPNTNIYPCPFCKRKQRKKKFGDALRDKFVMGTIDKGIVREIDCDYCYLQTNNKNVRLLRQDPMKRLKYIDKGGE